MKTVFKSLSISVLALVMVVSVTTAASNVKKFTQKVIARSLTVQQDLLVKGDLTIEGNFDPQTISDVLGEEQTDWEVSLHEIRAGKYATVSDIDDIQIILSFVPTSATAGTFESTPLNAFFPNDEPDEDDADFPETFSGQYNLIGNNIIITESSSPTETEEGGSMFENGNFAVSVLSDGSLAVTANNVSPNTVVLLSPAIE